MLLLHGMILRLLLLMERLLSQLRLLVVRRRRGRRALHRASLVPRKVLQKGRAGLERAKNSEHLAPGVVRNFLRVAGGRDGLVLGGVATHR